MSVLVSTPGLTPHQPGSPYSPGVRAHDRISWRDAWLPALLLLVGAAELASLRSTGWAASVGLEAVAALALVFRRRLTLVAAAVATAAMTLIPVTGAQMNEAATPILFYMLCAFSVARWLTLQRALTGLGTILFLVFLQAIGIDPRDQNWTDVVFVLSLAVPPFVFGRVVLRLDEQKRKLAEQQDIIRDQAVQEERDRIARELHDVIAHSISAMVVQTAAAQDLVRSQPEQAEELLRSVADTGRGALTETGRLLHLVRDESGELGLSPAPSVGDIPDLVRSFRESGLDLDAELDLPTEPLPGGLDVSVYRVVQEALTNAMKHAEGPVRLRLSTTPDSLRVQCTNRAGSRSSVGAGLGLRGMAERVGLLGGSLDEGVTPSGDFVLDVALPLPRPVA